MREGELFITVTSGDGQFMSSPLERTPTGSFGMPVMVTGEGPFWRERTGEKKGWVVKREMTQTLKISGLRCTGCGYIELYARK